MINIGLSLPRKVIVVVLTAFVLLLAVSYSDRDGSGTYHDSSGWGEGGCGKP